MIELSWVVGKLGIGYAIALNPAQRHGMDFEAQDAGQIASLPRLC